MWRKRTYRTWADGVMWEPGEYERARKLAVAITGPDVQLIGQLVRHCEQARRRGRPDMVSGSGWDEERHYQQLVADLYERAGAAAAQDGPQTVPLTMAEIRQVEQLRYQIQYFTGYYMHSRDPMLDQADDLLHRLHFLAGHARATGDVGGVTVFRGTRQLPAGGGGRGVLPFAQAGRRAGAGVGRHRRLLQRAPDHWRRRAALERRGALPRHLP